MCPNVTPVEESRPIIWDPPKTYNPWAFPSENGKISVWTSLWVCLAPRVGTTRYGSSWTAWLSQPTSYPYPPQVRQYAELYISHIVRYHGIPKTIISGRGSIFVALFQEQLHECLGTNLIRSSAYHLQIDGQTERVNQIIEDVLHACVLTDVKWDKHLPLAEFSYNNSYQESIKMSPFKALYGRTCCTPLCWSESGERVIFGPDIVIEVEENVKQIWANILAAQSR
jgi:hypothetical protein